MLLPHQGQVMLEKKEEEACIEFEAELFLLFHNTKITPKYQATVHIGNIIQTAVIKHMDRVIIIIYSF